MFQLRRPRWLTVAMAVLAPAILIVFGGGFSGGIATSVHERAAAMATVHDLAMPSVSGHVWGPPALTYSVAPPAGSVAPSGAAATPGSLGAGASSAGPYGAAPAGSDAGAFTPMTHCSKMPRIMDLQTH